jgi:hypothetical protein
MSEHVIAKLRRIEVISALIRDIQSIDRTL